jgi:hypothetical protein
MFEKMGRLAEGLATSVATSRRGFLGRIGQSALGVAGAMGALAVASGAQTGGVVCCTYDCGHYGRSQSHKFSVCLPGGSTCASPYYSGYGPGCTLVKTQTKSDCSKC